MPVLRAGRLAVFAGFVAAMEATGCSRIEGEHAPAARRGRGRLHAGVAVVEIGPVPGFPMGGHALESRVALGTWTPLFARALYLEDAAGEPLILVSTDLWAVSAGLADEVARRLREDRGLPQVGRENLVLAATHTHHGPGNFSSNRVYNQHASNLPGFDPVLFDYMADRIATSVVRAAASAVPARVVKKRARIAGVARNRSFGAFEANPEAGALLAANADLPLCREDAPGPPSACRAIDPTARLLVVERLEDARPIAVAAQFAMHPTAMPNHTEVYHGDVFGLAAARLEAALDGPVVLLFNGPEGDVSPNWWPQGPAETRRIADLLARQIVEATRGPEAGEVTGPFLPHHAVVKVAGRTVENGPFGPLRTARRPLPGRSQLVGAEDGPTVFRRFGWHEGMALPPGDEAVPGQGRKLPAVWAPLALASLPPGAVPETVPVDVIEAAGLTVAALPGEFTTALGLRIRRAVEHRTGTPALLLGLAGEYLGYFTTPEAYDRQHYEGASMMYGRDAGHLLAHEIVTRAGRRGRPDRARGRYRYAPGRMRRFGLHVDAVARMLLSGAEARVRGQLQAPAAPSMWVEGPPPAWPPDGSSGGALPKVEVLDRKGRPVPAPPDAHACVVISATSAAWTYACFFVDAAYLGQRLRVTLPGVPPLCSPPLAADDGSAAHVPAEPCP